MRLHGMIVILLVSFLTVQPTGTLITPDYYPTDEWESTTPEEQGMNSTILDMMDNYIEKENLAIDSILVIKNGYIIDEANLDPIFKLISSEPGPHGIYSCTKNIISTLIGIAIDQGLISSVNHKILDFFPDHAIANLDAYKQAITIENLLTMTSGLNWTEMVPYTDPANTFNIWKTSENWVQFVLDKPMVTEPGSVFNYNTGASHLLSAIIQKVTGDSTLRFAQKYLFDPIGIKQGDIFWATDPQGIEVGGTGLALTVQDMARYGYLYLNNGTWDGKQVVSSKWVELSTKAYIQRESWPYGYDYAYHWWIYPDLGIHVAMGYGGQRIFVIPDVELVVIFTAKIYNPVSDWAIKLLSNYIIAAEIPEFNEISKTEPPIHREITRIKPPVINEFVFISPLITFLGISGLIAAIIGNKRIKQPIT